MKVCILGESENFTASQALSISANFARANPAMVGPLIFLLISETASKSPLEAIGKPASIISTFKSAKTSAI